MDEPKRKLKIDMRELEDAFDHQDQIKYYLDLETGEVLMVTDEDRYLMDRMSEEYWNSETDEIDWARAMADGELQDWQKEDLEKLNRIEEGFGTRYIEIPQEDSYAGYNEMVEFIQTVTNPYLQLKLERAIQGKGAFRYFKYVMDEYPKERQLWFAFKNERRRRRALEWLEMEGIELIEDNEE